MGLDPLDVLAESRRLRHFFYGDSHVLGSRLVAGIRFGFEAAYDRADLVGLERAGQQGEQRVIVLLGDPGGIPHLRKVFTKLGLRSRRQLRETLTEADEILLPAYSAP